MRVIQDLEISRTDKHRSVRFSKIIPDDFRVLVAPNYTGEWWSSFVNQDKKIIVINGDITTPEKWLTLLHEGGHIAARLKEETDCFSPELNANRRTVNANEAAKKLLNERDAWAYGFKKGKPIFNTKPSRDFSVQKSDAILFAKSECLRSYNEWVGQQVRNNSAIHHFAMDFMDEMTGEWE